MIIIACDHAGFEYKLKLIEFLENNQKNNNKTEAYQRSVGH